MTRPPGRSPDRLRLLPMGGMGARPRRSPPRGPPRSGGRVPCRQRRLQRGLGRLPRLLSTLPCLHRSRRAGSGHGSPPYGVGDPGPALAARRGRGGHPCSLPRRRSRRRPVGHPAVPGPACGPDSSRHRLCSTTIIPDTDAIAVFHSDPGSSAPPCCGLWPGRGVPGDHPLAAPPPPPRVVAFSWRARSVSSPATASRRSARLDAARPEGSPALPIREQAELRAAARNLEPGTPSVPPRQLLVPSLLSSRCRLETL